MHSDKETDGVKCKGCGTVFRFQKGHLTEEGKKDFLCHICTEEPVLERRIEQKRIGDRKLLID